METKIGANNILNN